MDKYWDKFVRTGAVEDYLEYKGMEMCRDVMKAYSEPAAWTGERKVESDYSDRNGAADHSYR